MNRPRVRRASRALPVVLLFAGCSPVAGGNDATVNVTVHMTLAGGRNVGASPVAVRFYEDEDWVPRYTANPNSGQTCLMEATPLTSCTFAVPVGRTGSLLVVEPDPAVFVRLGPPSPQDTVRDGRFVEFTGWTGCSPPPDDRGTCAVTPDRSTTVHANFQLMQQVTVYQSGAARMDWITFAAMPMLKLPPETVNLLDLAGCRRVFNPTAAPCDSVRVIGNDPLHRFTAYVPRGTIVGMFPVDGAETEFVGWDGDCILSAKFGGGVCSLISPNVSADAILLTLRYQWWECQNGPSDRDIPGMGCILHGEPAFGTGGGRTGAREASPGKSGW